MDLAPSSERRLFITDTLVIFTAFQKVMESSKEHDSEWLLRDENVNVYRKLAIDYVNFIKECWIHTSQPLPRPDGPLQFNSEHYRRLYTCFSLFVVLYLPEPGATLRGLSKASLFFLDVLSRHPSEDLQSLTKSLAPLIESQPRLQHYSAERDFAYASRRWSDRVKTLRIEMDRVPEDARFDGFDNWWDCLSDIVGILEGRAEVVIRVCKDLGSDWKEVCAAWGMCKRLTFFGDFSDVVSQVLDDLPPDPTSLEDMIHAALFSGDPAKALHQASSLDRWLSAHLADFMVPLQLIDTDSDDESRLSLRDYHILKYAEYLQSDPALWRVTVDYMYTCGEVGKLQADEILLRVPLRLQEPRDSSSSDITGVLKDVSQTCLTYQREAVRRTICRVAAQTMISKKDYGLAAVYSISAEDWPGLGRVVERLLDEYIFSGPSSFANYASAIAPSVQELRNRHVHEGIFAHRLLFTVRYAHFHQLVEGHELQDAAADLIAIFREDLAPRSWWAVLLCDAIPLLEEESSLLFPSPSAAELLRKLEEIFVRSSQGAAQDYLPVLMRIIQGEGKPARENEALERLKLE
ncbi:hypothetical protein H0H92_013005 [Tricholoma furcatifolium]|nr:hypothetical protein H0H92_013005 [Tricholoma furcatifolium]